MSINLPNPSGAPGARKVAIPRLQRPGPSQGSPQDKRRVSRACTACRAHKVKCTGDKPACRHCASTGRLCIYIMPRKDKFKLATERCAQMAGFLENLRSWAGPEDNARIGELLDAIEEDNAEGRQPVPSTPSTDDNDSSASRPTFHHSFSGSTDRFDIDSLDLLDENLHENGRSRATGFVGKSSEVQWLRSLLHFGRGEDETARTTIFERRNSAVSAGSSEQVSAVSFYLDNEGVDLDVDLNPYELPDTGTAERLLNVYMDRVHDAFPILPRRLFEDQLRRYFQALSHDRAPRLNARWQAIVNLVFAISARYSHLVETSWRADERDHLIYQARARAFAWNESTFTQHPDLPQIQVAGLLAFYYLSAGQVSRAWVVVGVAIRFAIALGLHVRNEDPSASAPKREVLVRIWWSLCTLERRLSIITGRPSAIVDAYCSVPFPAPVPEGQISEATDTVQQTQKSGSSSAASSTLTSPTFAGPYPNRGMAPPRTTASIGGKEANSGSYLKAAVKISLIIQNILTSLYSVGTIFRGHKQRQQDIIHLNQCIDEWLTTLPIDFNFQVIRSDSITPFHTYLRERMLLGFQFCSARILLTKPFLSGLGQTKLDGTDATAHAGFSSRMASICIEAAKMELDMLPEQPDRSFLYEYGPWWVVIHHLMQAHTVFLLAISYSSPAFQDVAACVGYAKKTTRWLRCLNDTFAERAYMVAFNSFELVAKRLSLDISDLWSEHTHAFPDAEPSLDPDNIPSAFTHPIPAFIPDVTMSNTPRGVLELLAFDAFPPGSTFRPSPDDSNSTGFPNEFFNHPVT